MIDSHAHLTDERFAGDVDAVVERFRAAGVEAVVTIGTDLADSRAALHLARSYPDVYAAVGVHPHASGAGGDPLVELRDLAADERAVAIGETGLDYHYDLSPRGAQRDLFAGHLRLAADLGMPVVVHAREADGDLRAMLTEHARDVIGVLHCFSSGRDLLDTALGLGWYASFAGMITFKKYDQSELLRSVPADRLLVETDSPYLAPAPFRGKRNEPAHVALVAVRAAELREESCVDLGTTTARNARVFYRLGGSGVGAAGIER